MLTKLFGSEARVKVLSLFMLNVGSEYYLREFAEKDLEWRPNFLYYMHL